MHEWGRTGPCCDKGRRFQRPVGEAARIEGATSSWGPGRLGPLSRKLTMREGSDDVGRGSAGEVVLAGPFVEMGTEGGLKGGGPSK
jgi:hypothetical protein